MRTTTTIWAAALAMGLGACSGDSTGPGGSGDATMQVAAVGDDGGAAASRAPADGGAPRFAQTTAQGTVDFRARVYVQSQTDGWVELTNGTASAVQVDASGAGGARVFSTSRVNAGSYARVRVVFQDVRANLSSGLQVSTGLLTGQVQVDAESDAQVVVERQVAAGVSTGGTTRLLVNLNTDVWMNRASATTRTVSESEFASAVQVTAS